MATTVDGERLPLSYELDCSRHAELKILDSCNRLIAACTPASTNSASFIPRLQSSDIHVNKCKQIAISAQQTSFAGLQLTILLPPANFLTQRPNGPRSHATLQLICEA
jgi:hypothetical protein